MAATEVSGWQHIRIFELTQRCQRLAASQATIKVLNLSLTCTPNGGWCLKVHVPVEGQSEHLGRLGEQDQKIDSSIYGRWDLLVYWIIYQSDQLEEVGVYWKRDSKNPGIGREGRVALGRSSTIKSLIGVQVGQRAKHFGLAFAIDLRISEFVRFWFGQGMGSVSIKIAYHSTQPCIRRILLSSFDEDSPETTLHPGAPHCQWSLPSRLLWKRTDVLCPCCKCFHQQLMEKRGNCVTLWPAVL